MNRRPPGLKLVKAIHGFLQHKAAEALSPRTLEAYEHDLNTWLSQVGDVDIGSATTQELRSYLAWLRTDYKPRRVSGSDHHLLDVGEYQGMRILAPRDFLTRLEAAEEVAGGASE